MFMYHLHQGGARVIEYPDIRTDITIRKLVSNLFVVEGGHFNNEKALN